MDVLSRRSLVVLGLLVLTAAGVSAGGWSVIALADFPDYAMAGRPLTLTFSVRQHGQSLVSGLKPSVQASTRGAPAVDRSRQRRRREPASTPQHSSFTGWATGRSWSMAASRRRQDPEPNSIGAPAPRGDSGVSARSCSSQRASVAPFSTVTKGCVSCHAPGGDRDLMKRHRKRIS